MNKANTEGVQMAKKVTTKDRIVSVAWKLFYDKGYDNTTVDEIIKSCSVSKGAFYHYFRAKDDLLSSLPYMFDREYEKILITLEPDMHSFDKLLYLTKHLFQFIEVTVPVDLLALLYSSQVIKKGEKHLLDKNRFYYKTLNRLVEEGQKRNQIVAERSCREISNIYAMQERAVLYDWCICMGSYPLSSYGVELIRIFLSGFKVDES
jgi:AcrR family transcriptional regulator